MRYGSDLMAELIASLHVPYIALNPGASFEIMPALNEAIEVIQTKKGLI